MNCVNAQDHEPRAEHDNRAIKEALCYVALHHAPCKTMLKVVMQELAELVAEQIDVFPAKEEMAEHCSADAVANKQCSDCNEHLQHGFGDHVLAHHKTHQPTLALKEPQTHWS